MRVKKILSILTIVLFSFLLASCKQIGESQTGGETPKKYSLNIMGDIDQLYLDEIKTKYEQGEVVEIKTKILLDAEIEIYVNNVQVPKTDSDGVYWSYKFYMPNCDSWLLAETVDGFKEQKDYYKTIRFVNPEVKNNSSIINFDYLILNEPNYYLFKDYAEYEKFNAEVLNNIIVHPDVIGPYPEIMMYYIVLVVRKSNYNGNYLYHDFKYDLYGVVPKDVFDPAPVPMLAPMLNEDIFYAKFEDCLLIDFVFVPAINISEYPDYNV